MVTFWRRYWPSLRRRVTLHAVGAAEPFVCSVSAQACGYVVAVDVAAAAHHAAAVVDLDVGIGAAEARHDGGRAARGHGRAAREGYAGAALVCGGVDCLLGAAGVEADVYAVGECPGQVLDSLAESLQTVHVDAPDTRHDMWVSGREGRECQLGVEFGYGLCNEAAAARGHESEVAAAGLDLHVDAEGGDRAVDIGAAPYGVCAAAGAEQEVVGRDITLAHQTRHAAYAVTAHLGLRAVGVEHAHGIEVGVAHDVEYAVAGRDERVCAEGACERRQIGAGGIGMCRKVGHDEAVGRAVALYDI